MEVKTRKKGFLTAFANKNRFDLYFLLKNTFHSHNTFFVFFFEIY